METKQAEGDWFRHAPHVWGTRCGRWGLRLSGVGENLARDPTSVSFLLFIRLFVSSTFLSGHKNEQMKERNNYIQWEQQCPNLCVPLFSGPR